MKKNRPQYTLARKPKTVPVKGVTDSFRDGLKKVGKSFKEIGEHFEVFEEIGRFRVLGTITSPITFYATAGGIAAAFISVFLSFGCTRLSDKLQKTANDPSKIALIRLHPDCIIIRRFSFSDFVSKDTSIQTQLFIPKMNTIGNFDTNSNAGTSEGSIPTGTYCHMD
ncbi:protein TIC [Forsythia ovata]|uniref:Protein TIC n=1 Tax=Forsythia ovata TaxID=205694 RepID=A0ABD1W4F3_9LAMI